MSQMNCVNTALPLLQNSCHSISILHHHLSWTIHNHSSADRRKSSTSGLTNSGSMPLRSILLRSTPQPFNFSWSEIHRSHGKTHEYHGIRIQEILNSQKKKQKCCLFFAIFRWASKPLRGQTPQHPEPRCDLRNPWPWGRSLVNGARPVRTKSPSPRPDLKKQQPDDSSKIRFASSTLPLNRQLQHPQVKKISTIFYNTLQNNQSTDPPSQSQPGLMHQRSAWDIWLWRQLLIQQKAKRSNVALHR